MKKTLNQIVDYLEWFADNHNQVHDFSFGELNEISNINNTEIVYPLLHCQVEKANIEDAFVYLTMNHLVMDLTNKSENNTKDVLSDTLQILNDLRQWIAINRDFHVEGVQISRSDVYPFHEKFRDEVTGWNLQMTYKIKNTGICNIPFYVPVAVESDPCAGVELATEGFQIEGQNHGCGAVQNYYITGGGASLNADSFTWYAVNGTVQNNGFDAVDIIWDNDIATGQTYCVVGYDCGASVQSEILTLSLIPPVPIISPTTICPLQGQIYMVSNYTNTTHYTWTVTGDDFSFILNPGLNSQFYVEWSAGGGTLSVTATNDCGTSASSTELTTNC